MIEQINLLLGLTRWFPSLVVDKGQVWRDEYSRIAAARQLGEAVNTDIDSPALSALIRAAINDEDEQVRYAAIEAVCSNESLPLNVATTILGAATFDEHESIREFAFGLLATKSKRAFLKAASYLQFDDDADIKDWAKSVLNDASAKSE